MKDQQKVERFEGKLVERTILYDVFAAPGRGLIKVMATLRNVSIAVGSTGVRLLGRKRYGEDVQYELDGDYSQIKQ